jgi:hypothetical protein
VQPITKNQGLSGGYLDATKHIETAMIRLLTGLELPPVREQMAQMATAAQIQRTTSNN